jgi:two-component system sensor histidine kinase YesM
VAFAELPEEAKHWQVPRLILQPLVENIFRHGFANTEEQHLRVCFSLTGALLTVMVEDNGSVPDETIAAIRQSLQQQEAASGIVNVHKRMRLRYGEGAGVFPERSSLGGLCMKLVIPKGDMHAENLGG